MSKCVCNGAQLQCSFGSAPSMLTVEPTNRVEEVGPGANVLDMIPAVNIQSFAMCSAPTNPAVIAATAAAWGVPTPAPCVPAITGQWTPGNPNVRLANSPILTDNSKLTCLWAGLISITNSGQAVVQA